MTKGGKICSEMWWAGSILFRCLTAGSRGTSHGNTAAALSAGRDLQEVVKTLGVDYWSKEENLDFFDIKKINRLFEKCGSHRIKGVYLCGMRTNLAAYGPAAKSE